LGIEAALRGMGLGELIAEVLREVLEKDMVGALLDGTKGPA
jgi:hypothetical protein